MSSSRTFVDRGGTFTDVVVLTDGHARVRKVPSDAAIIGELAEGPLTFGTTVATNALLERAQVRVLLLVTEGFADLPWLGDMARPSLFDPDATWPSPLCHHVVEVRGRLDAEGREVEPLVLPTLDLTDIDAVAVVLLNSHRNPEHEQQVAAALASSDVFVSLGHRASPEVGYLARIETTLVDAGVTPLLQRSLQRDQIPQGALAMRSDGSLCPAHELRAPDAVLSGPAGGVAAVAAVAGQAGFAHAVGLDMGGTSTDVCRVDTGRLPRRDGEVRVAGVRLRRPMLEVDTIAAGGGSVLWNDGLQLGVGPRSAGADPGPQCYGRGGPPTLTDAALVAGLLDPSAFDPPLDVSAVQLPGSAEAFLSLGREAMAAAVRRLATSRGVDLRDHALVAYGGAAPQHAAEVAALLSVNTVLVHPCSAVLCAWGQSLARREEVATLAVWRPLEHAWSNLPELAERLRATLPELGSEQLSLDLRFTGTSHSLRLDWSVATPMSELLEQFHAEHLQRYGFARRSGTLEVVNLHLRVLGPVPAAAALHDDPWGLGDRTVEGPALLTSPTTSVSVPEGWTARRDRGLLRLDLQHPKPAPQETERTPAQVALWSSRFMAVAEQAGAVLQRLARSVNIRERLDFSCALFDERGHLVANAPHIPVHLGAMGETVRDLMKQVPDLPDGQAWLCNDPAAGGSHLPDLTVVTPVRHEGRRFYVASRGHHVDVGGSTPGSMPPRSTTLAEEGFAVRHRALLTPAQELAPLADLMRASRQPDTVRADLEAQVACNLHAARGLRALGPGDLIATWMAHLQDVATEAVRARLDHLPLGEARDTLDGIPLRVVVSRKDCGLIVDFTGTGGPHPGNLNAPRAVTRAAVLYALRVLVDEPIPLNEGALAEVRLVLPENSLLDPPPGAAVAGGNVETSQRVVDLVLRATQSRAASQGTMNNLTLGGEGWSLYETLGGGTGATPDADGPSAQQVHMTNTRATDPEVLEARLPVRVRRFARRVGSGGDGEHRGGDGLVRELELLVPGTAALLATRRDSGAPGLLAGGPGAPGRDHLHRGGVWQAWDGQPTRLQAGDRVRIETPGGGGYRPYLAEDDPKNNN